MGGILGNFNPFDGSLFNNITSNMQDMYNDYTGVTASKLSAEAAAKNTEKQIAWEKERATSAHQWEMEDLKKAGLNPILSAGGSGAATGSISPQMPDFSKYKGAGALLELGQSAFNNAISAQQIKNDTDRVLNETKETNSNLSMKRTQIELMLEEKLNKAAERGWINEKTATEIKNRAKLQSDIELAQSQEFLNEQLRGRAEYEIQKLEQETELLKAELDLHPDRKRRAQIENDLQEKENKIYYAREAANQIVRLGTTGLSIYGAFQANKAISAYKASQQDAARRTQFTERYDNNGVFQGGTRTYYK